MAYTIAVAGKGGVGKTTFCALLIRWLTENKKTPILAVDADPNSNLAETLGVIPEGGSISEIISKTKEPEGIPENMSQDEFISYKLNAALTETKHVDLISMGGPEGPGCYCFPNNVMKKHIQKLIKNYRVVVMDNEAGMEHISRGTTTENVDALFILSDTSRRSLRSAGRVYELTKELKVPIKETFLIITRGKEGDLEKLKDEICLPAAGMIPEDELLSEYELIGKALYDLPGESAAAAAVNNIAAHTLDKPF